VAGDRLGWKHVWCGEGYVNIPIFLQDALQLFRVVFEWDIAEEWLDVFLDTSIEITSVKPLFG